MPELMPCTCGLEPTLYIDMSKGPGCMCHVACTCGAKGNMAWDVRLPVDDLCADWNDDTERELRRALKMGFVTRDDAGRYTITPLGTASLGDAVLPADDNP